MSLRNFEEVIRDTSGGNAKVQKGEYLSSGLYPIIDQGQEFIGGFTNDPSNLVKGEGPWIVFGDHTRALKFVDFPFCMGADGVKVLQLLRPLEADLKYVCHFLQFANIPSAGYSRHYKFLKRLQIPLPLLGEQKRIAAILEKADQLRQKRRQAIALVDSLTQSIFLEMFGRASALHKLGDVASIRSGSTPSRTDPNNFGGSIPWVKTTEVKGRIINSTEELVTKQGVAAARLKFFAPGTILIAMYGQGTTRGNVAMLGLSATINQACAAIVPTPSLDPTFLFHQLRLKYNEIRSLGRGGNQPNLNLELVASIEVVIPDMEEQLKFKRIADDLDRSRSRQVASTESCEGLFSSLQHRAFTGQL